MSDTTPTNPAERTDAQPAPEQPTTTYPSSPAGWGSAPTPTSTATLDASIPAPSDPYAAHQPYASQGPYSLQATSATPYGATPWYGSAATPGRKGGPKPPWFWPVIAVAVGLAALLVGGGIGFAVGHAIGGGTSQSTTQVPGNGTNGFPGGGTNGGTNQFPGTSGSSSNS